MGSDNAMAVREELESVERTIAELRRTVAALRQESGSDGPADPEDVTSLITSANEQEAVIAELEERREELRRRLGLDPAD
jgi:polyhydroxyalkanoate synthesis regulator phasin